MDTHVVADADAVQVEEAVRILKLLAVPTRLRIVQALLHGEHGVGELAEHLGVRQAAMSQHLAKLRRAGVVTTRRSGNRIFYRVVDDHISRLVAEAFSHALHVHPAPVADEHPPTHSHRGAPAARPRRRGS